MDGGQEPERAVALYVELSLLQPSYHRLSPCVVGIFGSNPQVLQEYKNTVMHSKPDTKLSQVVDFTRRRL